MNLLQTQVRPLRLDNVSFTVVEEPGHTIRVGFKTADITRSYRVNKAHARELADKLLYAIRASVMDRTTTTRAMWKGGAA